MALIALRTFTKGGDMSSNAHQDGRRDLFRLPILTDEETTPLTADVARGRKALGALFLACLNRVAVTEAGMDMGHDPLRRRLLAFEGFKRGVRDVEPTADQERFWAAIEPHVLESLSKWEAPDSCDEFVTDDFVRMYVTRAGGRKLKPKAVHKLIALSQVGFRQLNVLLEHNLRLLLGIVNSKRKYQHLFDDMISAGVVGLRRGILRFEHVRGFKLSTYVMHWAKQGVNRYLSNHRRNVRIPVHTDYKARKIREVTTVILERERSEGGRGEFASVAEIVKRTGYSEKAVMSAIQSGHGETSLDTPVHDDLNEPFSSTIAIDQVPQDVAMIENIKRDSIKKAIEGALTEREAYVIRERFLGDGRTLEDIAGDFGLSRERIRQIEAEAKTKLRRHLRQAGIIEK